MNHSYMYNENATWAETEVLRAASSNRKESNSNVMERWGMNSRYMFMNIFVQSLMMDIDYF